MARSGRNQRHVPDESFRTVEKGADRGAVAGGGLRAGAVDQPVAVAGLTAAPAGPHSNVGRRGGPPPPVLERLEGRAPDFVDDAPRADRAVPGDVPDRQDHADRPREPVTGFRQPCLRPRQPQRARGLGVEARESGSDFACRSARAGRRHAVTQRRVLGSDLARQKRAEAGNFGAPLRMRALGRAPWFAPRVAFQIGRARTDSSEAIPTRTSSFVTRARLLRARRSSE
jgi:hypothetical protein